MIPLYVKRLSYMFSQKTLQQKEHMKKLNTTACQFVIFSSPPLEGLFGTQMERNAHKEQILHNIYDATIDHSILKHGLEKSLSTFQIENAGQENPRKPSFRANSIYKRNQKKKQITPKHIEVRTPLIMLTDTLIKASQH
jgi:hypothetical protein